MRASYAYNRWATNRILDAAAGITSEQWLKPQTAGRGSIRDTMVHFMSAQRGWLAWWDGSLPPEVAYRRSLEPSDYPDVAAARALSTEIDDKTCAFADRLTEAEAQRVYSFPTPNGPVLELPLWKMMLHVANHGTQHRSEVAAMLTAFGSSPGSLDQLGFFLSGGGAPQ